MSLPTFTWKVESLECKPTANGHTDVVSIVHWRCNAERTENENTVNVSVYGSASLGEPGETFIEYENLTEQQILNWLYETGLNFQSVTEENLSEQLEALLNPSVVKKPLPW